MCLYRRNHSVNTIRAANGYSKLSVSAGNLKDYLGLKKKKKQEGLYAYGSDLCMCEGGVGGRTVSQNSINIIFTGPETSM
jgi:hypothetical protein